MSILPALKFGARLTRRLRAQPGQLVYSKERPSITACFYEFLVARGISLSHEETEWCLRSFTTTTSKLGRPCIILGHAPNGGYNVCFIAQIRAAQFSPIGRFFGVPMGREEPGSSGLATSAGSFPPLRLTAAPASPRNKPQFYLFAIPVVRHRIHLPPGEPRRLVPEDLQRAVEVVRAKALACYHNHPTLRREQMQWMEETPAWQFKNPLEGGVNLNTYLKL